MAIKINFVQFGNLVGSVNFDNDTCYDECHGWIKLINGPTADDVIIYEAFYNPLERTELMQQAFEKAAGIMAKQAKMYEGF